MRRLHQRESLALVKTEQFLPKLCTGIRGGATVPDGVGAELVNPGRLIITDPSFGIYSVEN
jgi:hypothetical protein